MVKRDRIIKENSHIVDKAIKMGIEFHNRKSIFKNNAPEQLIKKIAESLPKKGKDISQLLDHFEKEIMPFCIAQCNPRYLSFPDSGNSLSGIIADILKNFTNQNLIADNKSAPIATYIEIQVIQWLRKLIGFENKSKFPSDISKIGGVFCTGGVLSNITAMLVARSNLLKNSFERGIGPANAYVLAPEEIGHYSIETALGYLGFGTNNLIKVKVNKDFGMDIHDLENKITNVILKKRKILCVVAYAGDSRTMKVDNLKKIHKLCKKYNIWMHVDACHGGQLLFSKINKKSIEGIELADSVTLDPHKVLMVSYPCSIVLFKNSGDLLHLARNFDMTILPDTYDLGQISPFIGSKAFDSLKIWFLFKTLGVKRIQNIIDRRIKLTKRIKEYMDEYLEIKIFNKININSICFIFFPKNLQKQYRLADKDNKEKIEKRLDALNKKIHDEIYKEGSFCIHTFKLPDAGNRASLRNSGPRQVLGITIGNPLTTEKEVRSLIRKIIKIGDKFYKGSLGV